MYKRTNTYYTQVGRKKERNVEARHTTLQWITHSWCCCHAWSSFSRETERDRERERERRRERDRERERERESCRSSEWAAVEPRLLTSHFSWMKLPDDADTMQWAWSLSHTHTHTHTHTHRMRNRRGNDFKTLMHVALGPCPKSRTHHALVYLLESQHFSGFIPASWSSSSLC